MIGDLSPGATRGIAVALEQCSVGATQAKLTEDHWLYVGFLRRYGWVPEAFTAIAGADQVILTLERSPRVPTGYVGPVALAVHDRRSIRPHVRFTRDARLLLEAASLWSSEPTWVHVGFEPGLVIVTRLR
jgi:hypothetical protein